MGQGSSKNLMNESNFRKRKTKNFASDIVTNGYTLEKDTKARFAQRRSPCGKGEGPSFCISLSRNSSSQSPGEWGRRKRRREMEKKRADQEKEKRDVLPNQIRREKKTMVRRLRGLTQKSGVIDVHHKKQRPHKRRLRSHDLLEIGNDTKKKRKRSYDREDTGDAKPGGEQGSQPGITKSGVGTNSVTKRRKSAHPSVLKAKKNTIRFCKGKETRS